MADARMARLYIFFALLRLLSCMLVEDGWLADERIHLLVRKKFFELIP